MRKLVVPLLLATLTLSAPALAHTGVGGVGFAGDFTVLDFKPDVENKGDGPIPPKVTADNLSEFLLDLDASDFLPDVENQGGAHPIPSDPPSPPRA